MSLYQSKRSAESLARLIEQLNDPQYDSMFLTNEPLQNPDGSYNTGDVDWDFSETPHTSTEDNYV